MKCKVSDPPANFFCSASSSRSNGRSGLHCFVQRPGKKTRYAHEQFQHLLVAVQKGPEDVIR